MLWIVNMCWEWGRGGNISHEAANLRGAITFGIELEDRFPLPVFVDRSLLLTTTNRDDFLFRARGVHKALILWGKVARRKEPLAEQCCWCCCLCCCLAKLGRSDLCCPVAAATFRKPSFLVSGCKTSARTHQSRSFASYHHFCQLLLLITLA